MRAREVETDRFHCFPSLSCQDGILLIHGMYVCDGVFVCVCDGVRRRSVCNFVVPSVCEDICISVCVCMCARVRRRGVFKTCLVLSSLGFSVRACV